MLNKELYSRQKKQALLKKFKRGGNRLALLCLFKVLFNDYKYKDILVSDLVSKITIMSYQNLKRQLSFFEDCGFFKFEHRFDVTTKKKRLKGSIPYTYIASINLPLINELVWFLREKKEMDDFPERYIFQQLLKPKHKLGRYVGLYVSNKDMPEDAKKYRRS